jgi:DNA-binding YbaB/EbfC family protein
MDVLRLNTLIGSTPDEHQNLILIKLTLPHETDTLGGKSNASTHRRKREAMAAPNMMGMMKQLQKVQEKMARVQEELESKTVVAESGGGMVKVTANGKQHIVRIQIEKEVVDPADVEMLEDLVLAATNKALDEASRVAQEEMAKVTSGMLPNIPGLGLPGF